MEIRRGETLSRWGGRQSNEGDNRSGRGESHSGKGVHCSNWGENGFGRGKMASNRGETDTGGGEMRPGRGGNNSGKGEVHSSRGEIDFGRGEMQSSGDKTGRIWGEMPYFRGILDFLALKPVRAGILVETGGNDSVAANVSSLILKNQSRLTSAATMKRLVAVRKNLDLVWVWFYKEVAPTPLFKGANPAK